MNDSTLPQFKMRGAREMLERYPGARLIERQVEILENTISESPEFAFDLAKALVETVCKTILIDRGVPLEGSPDLPQLFRQTLRSVHLLPEEHAEPRRTTEGLEKTIRGLQQAIQGLCELRSSEGVASHGRDGYYVTLEPIYAQLAATSADTIIHFLYHCHITYPNTLEVARLHFEDEDIAEFNDYVDDVNGIIQIFDFTYRASEVLFYTDLKAYRTALIDFGSEVIDDDSE